MGKKVVWALALSGVLFASPRAATATTLNATVVEDNTAGLGCSLAQPCLIPTNALGPANGTYYSLGRGGSITLSFGTIFTGPGEVWEVTPFDNRGPFPEFAEIYTSLLDNSYGLGGAGWTHQDSVSNAVYGTPITIVGDWRYLAVKDVSARTAGNGFDLDAVLVTQREVVPEPALLSLFGLGLLGMGRRLGRSRRRAA